MKTRPGTSHYKLEIENLSKWFDVDVPVLRDINLRVPAGSVHVIMGLSGGGKSTLLRCINLLTRPSNGRILLDGEELTALSEQELRRVRGPRISMVFQGDALLPHRTVLENVALGEEIQGVPKAVRHENARAALRLVNLAGRESAYPEALSGGMRQRVGIARALTSNADVILMDEPFSGLDPITRGAMQDYLLDLQRRLELTVIFVTHDATEAIRLADEVTILDGGVIAQSGGAADVFLNPATQLVREFARAVDPRLLVGVGNLLEGQCRNGVGGTRDCVRSFSYKQSVCIDSQAQGRRVTCMSRLSELKSAIADGQPRIPVMLACDPDATELLDSATLLAKAVSLGLWGHPDTESSEAADAGL